MRTLKTLAFITLVVFLPACGASVAGIATAIGGGGGSGGGSNAPPGLSDVSIVSARTSPATILFNLIDNEGDPVDVRLFYSTDGAPRESIALAIGEEELDGLPTSRNGVLHERRWDFGSQLGSGFRQDVSIEIQIVSESGKGELLDPVSQTTVVELGNDRPAISLVTPPDGEVVGIAAIQMIVSDTSSDFVSVQLEYDLLGDSPDQGFQTASAIAGTPTAVVSSPGGTPFTFVWDVVADAGTSESEVVVRLTPNDGDLDGAFVEATLRIDNNREPRVALDSRFLLSPDVRRRIPIPFTVFDEEADDVQVVFQWRRASQSDFEPLPEGLDPDRFRERLEDPAFRKKNQICTEIPLTFGGHVVPVDATTVRLPELASSASALVELDPETSEPRVRGELEILRSSGIPTPVAATWSGDPELREPVAVLPVGVGLKALVLERLGSQWRLREVELATGGDAIVVASGTGQPSAMAYEPDETSVLIALVLDETGTWQVRRVDLGRPGGGYEGEPLVTADGSNEGGTIRGIASLGKDAGLITVGSSLIRLDYSSGGAARSASLFGPPPLIPLRAPWGVVVDPLARRRVYVSERDADCVLVIDLDARSRRSVIADPTQRSALRRPEGLALERSGTRLLVVTDSDPEDGTKELMGVEVGGSSDLDGDGLGDQHVFEIQGGYSGETGAVATGNDHLRVLALPGAGDLAVGGGLLHRRTLLEDSANYGPERQLVRVDAPFDPPLRPLQRWRVQLPTATEVSPGAQQTIRSFVWDSDEVRRGEFVFVRAVPFDSEKGLDDQVGPKRIRQALDVVPLSLGSPGTIGFPNFVRAADLDGDGDLDIVSANPGSNTLTAFFQGSGGVFDPIPLTLGAPGTTDNPRSVEAADLDGDGDLDIVSANGDSDTLTVFFQKSAAVFDPVPLVLGDSDMTDSPESVRAADLDGDGDLDIVSANGDSDTLTIFFQKSAAVFDPVPLVLGDPATTNGPMSVKTADLDGDGDLDIVSANGSSNTLTVFFQEGRGVFDATPLVLGGSGTTSGPSSVDAADLDGNGKLDIVSSNRFSDTLTVFFQESAGVFNATPLVLGSSGTTNLPSSVRAADLDGDGDLDIVSSNVSSNTLTVFFQEDRGVFDPDPLTLGAPGTTGLPRSVEAADLDGDGDLDLVSTNAFDNTVTVFVQEGRRVFASTPLALGDSDTTDSPFSVTAADLDGDGDLDIVSANVFSDNLTVFLQSSAGMFEPTPIVLGDSATTDAPVSVKAADLDGDGDLDIVSANRFSNNLTVFFQTSAGVFGATPLTLGGPLVTAFPSSVEAADLDGDGDLDIVSANELRDSLTIFFQEGRGVFDPTPLVLGVFFGAARSVKAADLDGDGDLDIVTANERADTLTVFFQESSGVFNPTPLTLGDSVTTESPVSVEAADIDGDGELDLISANRSTLTVFFQEGGGEFDPIPLTLGASGTTDLPTSVTAADFDGDGDLDLVSANRNNDNLTVFFQKDHGVFDSTPLTLGPSETTDSPRSLKAVDLDGDGDLDIVSANGDSDSLTVFFGQSSPE